MTTTRLRAAAPTTAPATAPTASVRQAGAQRQGPAAIRLQGVTKTFGSVQAVRGIDLEIAPGEVVAFLGPNGAGKTTTVDMVLGLSEPTTGEVRVLGMEPRSAIAHGLVSAVMQTGGLLKDLTVRETLTLTASLFADTRAVDEVLQIAGITELAGRKVGACSGGEQQRLRFAMALLPDPALLLLDEPTTGMDVEGRRRFWSTLRADADRGRTVLFATHYLEEADQYADRIVLVSRGRVVADGTGAEIKALASGRTVHATVTQRHDEVLQGLAGVPGVVGVEQRGDQVVVRADDSDAVARYLLTSTDAHDLEITAQGLEQAFLDLTGDHDDPTAASQEAHR